MTDPDFFRVLGFLALAIVPGIVVTIACRLSFARGYDAGYWDGRSLGRDDDDENRDVDPESEAP
jgi:hypothetical protein